MMDSLGVESRADLRRASLISEIYSEGQAAAAAARGAVAAASVLATTGSGGRRRLGGLVGGLGK